MVVNIVYPCLAGRLRRSRVGRPSWSLVPFLADHRKSVAITTRLSTMSGVHVVSNTVGLDRMYR
jgi:hypothetical protein